MMGVFVFAIGAIIAALMVGQFEKWKCEDRVGVQSAGGGLWFSNDGGYMTTPWETLKSEELRGEIVIKQWIQSSTLHRMCVFWIAIAALSVVQSGSIVAVRYQ